LKFVREQFFLAAIGQNIKRLVRFFSRQVRLGGQASVNTVKTMKKGASEADWAYSFAIQGCQNGNPGYI